MRRLSPEERDFLNTTIRRVNTLETYRNRGTKGLWSNINQGQDGIQSSDRIRCGEVYFQERVIDGWLRYDDATAICRLWNQAPDLFTAVRTLIDLIEELSQ